MQVSFQGMNLADFMLHNNLFKFPQLSPPPKKQNIGLPKDYQILDDAVTTTKTEVDWCKVNI